MIMDMVMGVMDFFSSLILGFVQLPIFPPELSSAISIVLEWMAASMGILDVFLPLNAIAPAIAFFFVVYTIQKLYFIVMWVLKKIPMLGME